MNARILPFLLAATVLLGVIALSLSASAAPAAPAPVCQIEGTVLSITEREVAYKDDSWRKSWNLPESITYTDVTINVTEESLVENAGNPEQECKAHNLPEKRTYQLRDKNTKLKEDQKIRAHTQYSGDEFAIGNWLYNITPSDQIKD